MIILEGWMVTIYCGNPLAIHKYPVVMLSPNPYTGLNVGRVPVVKNCSWQRTGQEGAEAVGSLHSCSSFRHPACCHRHDAVRHLASWATVSSGDGVPLRIQMNSDLLKTIPGLFSLARGAQPKNPRKTHRGALSLAQRMSEGIIDY